MKKLISMIMVLLIIVKISAFSAFCAESITLNIKFDAGENAFYVSGKVESEKDRFPLTLYISSGNEPIAVSETLAFFDDENVVFNFDKISVSNMLSSGTFTFVVGASILEAKKTVEFNYYGGADILIALNKLSEAIDAAKESDNINGLISAISETADILGRSKDDFDAMNETAQRVFARSFLEKNYVLPQDSLSKENAKTIRSAVKEYGTHYDEAFALGSFFDAGTSQEIQSWYDINKITYGLLQDTEETQEDETKMLSYFNDAIKSNGYLERRANIADVKSMKELNVAMKHQAMLEMVEISNQFVVRNIIQDFATLLTADVNAFKSLSATEQSEVCIEISGKDYTSFNGLSDAIDEVISRYTGILGSIGSTGGPTGSSNKGGGNNMVYAPVMQESDVKNTVANFEDIGHVKWAQDAIKYLYKQGIVSGRDENTFAPDDSITRAEFIKMIVSGFGLETENTDNKFSDVADNAWYKDYVITAQACGLVNGDESGRFNPNESISRQDAATMLYRLLNPQKDFKKADFKDYDKVSDYAKKAVDYMQSEGIINGIGDGIFAPKNNVTRAQAAKMLYLLLV